MSFPTYSSSHFKSSLSLSLSLSSNIAPCDWCHVETRTRHNFECWVSGGKGQTYQSGDARSLQRGCLATKIGTSGQSGEWRQQKKRVGLAKGNWGSSGSNFEVESSHVYRQENVNLAHRKLGRKTKPEQKSAENSPCTRKLDASSPELVNTRFSDHPYMGKIFQCIQKKLGRTAI